MDHSFRSVLTLALCVLAYHDAFAAPFSETSVYNQTLPNCSKWLTIMPHHNCPTIATMCGTSPEVLYNNNEYLKNGTACSDALKVGIPICCRYINQETRLGQANSKCISKCDGVPPKPVCGSDGITYISECSLEFASCQAVENGGDPITVVNEGPCDQECPNQCKSPNDNEMVCGSDGVTYVSLCHLRLEACTSPEKELVKFSDGACAVTRLPQKPGCFLPCPNRWRPVCGSDGNTYPNFCALMVQACLRPRLRLRAIRLGRCRRRFGQAVDMPTGCPVNCPAVNAPVCGSDGFTYDNECILEEAKCFEPEKIPTKIHDRECQSDRQSTALISEIGCAIICTLMYRPVCGSDGRTYSNLCFLLVHACRNHWKRLRAIHGGRCRRTRFDHQIGADVIEDPQSCPNTTCTTQIDPVCGSDGFTYDNECVLEDAKCREHDLDLKKVHDGECKDQPDREPTALLVRPFQHRCFRFCPNFFNPVCGSNGITYSNLCYLKIDACFWPFLTVRHFGRCRPFFFNENRGMHAQGQCNSGCPRNIEKVCGSDGVTYDNECLLKLAACEHPDKNIVKVHDGECATDCPEFCPANFEPVCGSDGMSYSNDCSLRVEACLKPEKHLTKAHDGPCDEVGIPKRLCGQCRPIFKPICGSDGVTYESNCALEAAACRHPEKEIVKISDGECGTACPRFCPFIWNPVCGSDGKTYPSPCALQQQACQNPRPRSLTIVKWGPCDQDCSFIRCEPNPIPVCGTNGKTYHSSCLLQMESCLGPEKVNVAHNGPCSKDCPQSCPDEFTPVCDSNGRSHTSYCRFIDALCKNNAALSLKSFNKCDAGSCPSDCSPVNAPVCGSDGVTYPNLCSLGLADCLKPQLNIVAEHTGKC